MNTQHTHHQPAHRHGYHQRPRQQCAKRLPPYGRDLIAALRTTADFAGFWGSTATSPQITVFVGSEAWDTARRYAGQRRLFTMLPPDETDPAMFDWSFLSAGTPPILIQPCGDADDDTLHRLAVEIVSAGVDRVLVLGNGRLYRREMTA